MKRLIWVFIFLSLAVATTPAFAVPISQADEGEIYIAQADDRLGKIAEKYYEDPTAIYIIVEGTNAKAVEDRSFAFIAAPNWIKTGQKVWISTAAHPAYTVGFTSTLQTVIYPFPSTFAFSADDSLLAINTRNKNIQVWDTQTWDNLWAENQGDYPIRKVAISPDGQRLAAIGDSDLALLWEPRSGNLITEFSHPDWDGYLNDIAFSPDSRLLAISGPKKILIADATSGQFLYDLTTDLRFADDLAFSSNNQWLTGRFQNGRGPGKVVVWDVTTQEERILFKYLTTTGQVAFSPDSKWLASGLLTNDVVGIVWETQIWPEPITLINTSANSFFDIDKLVFSPDSQWFAGIVQVTPRDKTERSAADREAWIWEVSTWQLASKIVHGKGVLDIEFSPDGQGLITVLKAGDDPSDYYDIALRDVRTGKLLARIPDVEGVVGRDIAFSNTEKWLVTSGSSGMGIWQLESVVD